MNAWMRDRSSTKSLTCTGQHRATLEDCGHVQIEIRARRSVVRIQDRNARVTRHDHSKWQILQNIKMFREVQNTEEVVFSQVRYIIRTRSLIFSANAFCFNVMFVNDDPWPKICLLHSSLRR